MSTFRLLARTFPSAPNRKPKPSAGRLHLTTGTFNLLSKTNSHFRLSGAPSVRPDSTEGIRTSSKPFKTIRFQNRCQPAEITGFPPVFNSSGELQSSSTAHSKKGNVRLHPWRVSLRRARKRSSAGNGQKIGARRNGRRLKNERSLGGSAMRGNPSGNSVPECEPRKGANWRLTILDATSCRADAANSSDTQSLVLGSILLYQNSPGSCKRRIKKVTCSAQHESFGVFRPWSFVVGRSLDRGDSRPIFRRLHTH